MLMLLALLACGPAVESDAVVLYEDGVEVLRCDGAEASAHAGDVAVEINCGALMWAGSFDGDPNMWRFNSGEIRGYDESWTWDEPWITGWAESPQYLLTFDVRVD